MRNFFAFGCWLLVVGCWQGCSNQEPTPEELAGKAAKEYYDRLLAGDYEAFLQGKADSDSLPSGYRQELLHAYERFMQEQENNHGGIVGVALTNARNDSLQQVMQAFLLLTFKDSVKEEIVIPMVLRDGQWKMR
ncbi:MAG: hypothetical protein IJV17_05555 [Prevotella sp.]|nr:hypothetical protein [Prevotella sp.]